MFQHVERKNQIDRNAVLNPWRAAALTANGGLLPSRH